MEETLKILEDIFSDLDMAQKEATLYRSKKQYVKEIEANMRYAVLAHECDEYIATHFPIVEKKNG